MPDDGPWATLRDHLVDRLPVPSARVDAMLAEGRIVDHDGPLGPDAPFVPRSVIWFHRDLPDEAPVPFDLDVVHRDEEIVVVDKPHFLATIPRGRHVRETALVRLRHQLGLPMLSPAHRLDRVTAGLVLFVVEPARRGTYQNLFRDRRVAKAYEAIAPYDPALALPRVVRSRIVKERGVVTAQEVPGEPNAETLVELVEVRDGADPPARARYRLTPRTGRTHQLRVHMSSLGLPLLGDPFYPEVRDVPLDDFRAPLQLLARELAFPDPRTGEERRFTSRRTLQAWDDPTGWEAGV
ncbi:tRNA pseudouridine32 synthase/23S rRNA pseudouridine746 synthase [Actinomycetospora succinea]|uniref:RNA pseudouridylate synthase n=1 Tax=Actinomycetospora succinea TaxID=663603 RepID=A0A4R6V2A7_9PSEU|nr:RluA family pseudouridine synthase [Actinomycetospora succinea]TDQ50224.1 tRNA pseudouridine32 synthase/23S rRNA pseudouridine746 synthase [Actinomycetospora succinea]